MRPRRVAYMEVKGVFVDFLDGNFVFHVANDSVPECEEL